MKKQIKSDILIFIGLFLCLSNPFTPVLGLIIFEKGLDLIDENLFNY